MEPAPEIVALLQRYYQASTEGDADFLDQLISRSPDALVIGTDDTEWWGDGAAIVQTWGAAWRQRGGLPVSNSQAVAFRAGPVAWAADHAEWQLPDGRRIPFRLTAVFQDEAAGWRMVQAHFSIGVPNGEV